MAPLNGQRLSSGAQSFSKVKKGPKRLKTQHEYHSSSEEGEESAHFEPVELADSENDEQTDAASINDDASSQATDASSNSDGAASGPVKKRKRNDPDAFAASMTKILGSKLSSTKRADPVLSRSRDALTATKQLADSKLEAKARQKLREDKKAAFDRDRVKDVLGLEDPEASTAAIVEQERRLRKTAQRGVVKLFNAVRAAQVKGEEAAREARKAGVIGIGRREEKVNEMSKKGFLDLLIAAGGKKDAASVKI